MLLLMKHPFVWVALASAMFPSLALAQQRGSPQVGYPNLWSGPSAPSSGGVTVNPAPSTVYTPQGTVRTPGAIIVQPGANPVITRPRANNPAPGSNPRARQPNVVQQPGTVVTPGTPGRVPSVPYDVWRRWDRRQDYIWNNHRYRWGGASWVLIPSVPAYSYSSVSEPMTIITRENSTPAANPAEGEVESLGREVQRELRRLGYYKGEIDGVLGPATRAAIAEYQADQGMEASGRITQRLVEALSL